MGTNLDRKRLYNKEYQQRPETKIIRAEFLKSYQPKPNSRYNRLKEKAKSKGLTMKITLDDCLLLWSSPCHYCGGNCLDTRAGYGIDRVDTAKGYETSNLLPCCSVCNRAKYRLSQAEFDYWLQKLVNYYMEKNYESR